MPNFAMRIPRLQIFAADAEVAQRLHHVVIGSCLRVSDAQPRTLARAEAAIEAVAARELARGIQAARCSPRAPASA